MVGEGRGWGKGEKVNQSGRVQGKVVGCSGPLCTGTSCLLGSVLEAEAEAEAVEAALF